MLKWLLKPVLVVACVLVLVLAWARGVHVLAPQPQLNKGELLSLNSIQDAIAQPVPVVTEVSCPDFSLAQAYPDSAARTPEVTLTAFHGDSAIRSLFGSDRLPPVDERLPLYPCVVRPYHEVGIYGGVWRRIATGVKDLDLFFTHSLVNEPLVRFGPGGQLLPNLAYRWEIKDEGRVYRFYLRKGLKWSDGHPFTADDFLFAVNDLNIPELLKTHLPNYLLHKGKPVTITVLADEAGERTIVEFRFADPHPFFLERVAAPNAYEMYYAPKHYLLQYHPTLSTRSTEDLTAEARDLLQNKRVDYVDLMAFKRNPFLNPECPVITAWKLIEPPPATVCKAQRNPFYFKVDTAGNQLPYIDEIHFKMVTEPKQVLLQSIAGGIDMQARHLMFEDYPLLIQNRDRGAYNVLMWPLSTSGTINFVFNLNHPDPFINELFNKRDFRRAMSFAINRRSIIKQVFNDMLEPAQLAVPAGSPYYSEKHAKTAVAYDPDQARALLDKVGLTARDRDGFRLRPNGEVLLLGIETIGGSGNQAVELVCRDWRAVGVKVIMQVRSRITYDRRRRFGLGDIFSYSRGAEFNIVLDPRLFLPAELSLGWPQYALWLQTRGETGEPIPPGPVQDAYNLFERLRTEPEHNQRIALWQQIADIAAENLWAIGVATAPNALVVVNRRMRNVPDCVIVSWQFRSPGNSYPETYYFKPE